MGGHPRRARTRSTTAEVALLRTDKPDPATNAEAMAQLRITVKHSDERAVGRAFSARVTELALASYPGMFGDGLVSGARAYGVYWPTTVPTALVSQQVFIGGERTVVQPTLPPQPPVVAEVPAVAVAAGPAGGADGAGAAGPGRRRALGRQGRQRQPRRVGPHRRGLRVAGRFPDRRQAEGTAAGDRAAAGGAPRASPRLRAVNFVIVGLLGEGVAASTRLDPQAKSLGEWLRARVVDIPAELLP